MNKTRTNRINIAAIILIFSAIFVTSMASMASANYTTNLTAGQNINVGTVEVSNDATNLYVKYNILDDWKITETHLDAECSMNEIPQTKKGNPIPGHFGYSGSYNPAVATVNYTIALPDCEVVYIAAHAVVKNHKTETAWGYGLDFPGKNWATYMIYAVQEEPEKRLLETIIVPAIGTKMTSVTSLVANKTYEFKASGTCNWRVPQDINGYLGDAEYWLRHDKYGEGWTHEGLISLSMWNGTPVDIEWGAFNASHVYNYEYTPSANGTVTFFFNDNVYRDNSGNLTVNIYEFN